MAATSPPTSTPPQPPRPGAGSEDELEALSEAARGWHRIQLAVLGFIGFCGILWEGDAGAPSLVQYLGFALIASAFVLAVTSILLVGRVAHPVDGPRSEVTDPEATPLARRRRLRRGIWGTYLAVALLGLATLSSWLPSDATAGPESSAGPQATLGQDATPGAEPTGDPSAARGDEALVLVDVDARSWCGDALDASEAVLRVRTAEGTVELPRDRIAVLHPVTTC